MDEQLQELRAAHERRIRERDRAEQERLDEVAARSQQNEQRMRVHFEGLLRDQERIHSQALEAAARERYAVDLATEQRIASLRQEVDVLRLASGGDEAGVREQLTELAGGCRLRGTG